MRRCLLNRFGNAGSKFHFPFRNLSANTPGNGMVTQTKMERCRQQNVPGRWGFESWPVVNIVFHGKNSPFLGFVKCISMFKISGWEECTYKGNSTSCKVFANSLLNSLAEGPMSLNVRCRRICGA